MLSRFSLYDFLAVVIPGVFFLWSLGTILDLGIIREVLPLTGGLPETSILVIVGYITGLLLQGFSQLITENLLLALWGGFPSARWLLPEDIRLTTDYKKQLSEATEKAFGVALEAKPPFASQLKPRLKRTQEIFDLCYRSVEKLSEMPQTFVAQYGLFRALLTTFAVLAIVSIMFLVLQWWILRTINIRYLGFALTATGAAILSYYRAKKRADDFAKAVLDVFMAHNPKEART